VLGPSITRANSAHSREVQDDEDRGDADQRQRQRLARVRDDPAEDRDRRDEHDQRREQHHQRDEAEEARGGERDDAERELQRHEDEALPGHRVAQPAPDALDPGQVAALGRLRDRDAQEAARHAALDCRHRPPGGERGEQDPDADDQDRQRGADRDPDDQHDEVREPQRERQQHIGDVQPCLAAERDPCES
jgi:hypothetical protein